MSDSLKKVTLNLFYDDVQAMERLYGYGWSEQVRRLVRDHVRMERRQEQARTVGDLDGQ